MPSLMAVLGLNTTPFKRSLLQAQSDAQHAGREIKEAFSEVVSNALPFTSAAGAVFAGEEMFRRSVEWGEKIQNIATRLGISTDAVQLWDHALRQNGSSIESATGFFEKLGMARQKAMQGSEKETEAFKHLGVSLEDLKSKRIEDIAAQIAKVFEGGDPQKLISDLRSIGGRGAGELVAAFRNGLGEMVDIDQTELKIVTPEQIALLKEAADDLRTIGDNLKAIGAIAVVSVFQSLGEMFRRIKVEGAGVGAALIAEKAQAESETFSEKLSDVLSPIRVMKRAFQAYQEGKELMEASLTQQDLDKNMSTRKPPAGPLSDEEPETKKQAREAEKTANEILRINQETARVKQASALRDMTSSQRIEEIERRRARVKAEMSDAVDEKDYAQSNLNLAKINDELDRAKSEAGKEDNRHAENILRLKQETAKVQDAAAFREMSAAERVEEIQRRISRVKSEMADAVDEEDFQQSNLNLAKLNDALSGAKDEANKEESKEDRSDKTQFRLSALSVNDRQRIGAYAPPAEITAANATVRSERHLLDIKKGIDRLNQKSDRVKY